MKRFLAVGTVLFFILCLFGCSSAQQKIEVKDIDFTFSCKADVSCGGSSYTCAFSRTGPQNASVQILSEAGKGLTWYWGGDGFTQTYYGLSAKSEACSLPKSSFASVLVKTLDNAEKRDTLTRISGNEFSGNAEGSDYTLTADAKTGKIMTLAAPEWGFKASFYDHEQKTLQTIVQSEYPPD